MSKEGRKEGAEGEGAKKGIKFAAEWDAGWPSLANSEMSDVRGASAARRVRD